MLNTFFPLVFDSTMYAEFNSCMTSGFRKYIQHLHGSAESTDLIAGGAFAHGLEYTRKAFYNDGVDSWDAIEIGKSALAEKYGDHIPFEGNPKTCERMMGVLESYFYRFPMETDIIQPAKLADNTYAIEYSFALELPIRHPELDMPMIFVGRADMLSEYAGGLWVTDEKTTKTITKDWAEQWQTRGQFSAYCYGLREAGIEVRGAYIRGVGILKSENKFIECTTIRTKHECDIWYKNMTQKLGEIIEKYKQWKTYQTNVQEYFPGAWNEACNKYFRTCKFMDSCKTKNAELYLENAMGNEDQYIWLPHEQRREKLSVFLEDVNL